MSAITGVSAPDLSLPRIQRLAPDTATSTSTALASSQPARLAPVPRAASPDAIRDDRFEATSSGANTHVVRQVVQQITAALAYGAHVSVVSNGTGLHATIDVSG